MNKRKFLKTGLLAFAVILMGTKAKDSITFEIPKYKYAVIEVIHKDFHLHTCDTKENNTEIRPEDKVMFIESIFDFFKKKGADWRDARIIIHPDLKESFLDYIAKMC